MEARGTNKRTGNTLRKQITQQITQFREILQVRNYSRAVRHNYKRTVKQGTETRHIATDFNYFPLYDSTICSYLLGADPIDVEFKMDTSQIFTELSLLIYTWRNSCGCPRCQLGVTNPNWCRMVSQRIHRDSCAA